MNRWKYISNISWMLLFLISVILLAVDLLGLFVPLRSQHVYQDFTQTNNKIELDYKKAKEHLVRGENQSKKEFVYKVNEVVYAGTVHYWEDEGIEKYNLRVPFYENWLLYLASYIRPDIYRKYEFADYNKALERGVGLCSQRALIVIGVLNENGVEAQLIGLDGHVVLRAKVHDDTWYILDPDYGVVIPYDLHDIENNIQIVYQYYTKDITTNVSTMADIYGKTGNVIYPNGVIGYVGLKYYVIEYTSYIAIWILPLIVIIIFIIRVTRSKSFKLKR